jgi:gluconate:H+ symporter, GntP family
MSETGVLIVMFVALGVGVFALRWPTGLALALASIAGALTAGEGFAVRHLVEGTMLYLDPIMVVITSLFFMVIIERNGLLGTLNYWAVKTMGSRPYWLLIVLTFFVMMPGMFTGLTAPCVLTTGAMIAPVLMRAGLSAAKTGAFIATAAFFGMVAPPVNLAAMIIGSGVDMPYVGFGWPLALASFPLAIISSFIIVGSKAKGLSDPQIVSLLPPSKYAEHGIKLLLPLLLFIALLIGGKSLPQFVPYIGIPLMFVIAGIVGLFTGDKIRLREILDWIMKQALPIAGLLAGIGMFIQILTLTGARGVIAVSTLTLPSWFLIAGAALFVPLFGGISAYGSSSVLGVPLLLAMLQRNTIMVAAALSLLASVGDFLPPTRLAVILASPIVNEKANRILKFCLWPALAAVIWAVLMIVFANPLAKIFGLS